MKIGKSRLDSDYREPKWMTIKKKYEEEWMTQRFFPQGDAITFYQNSNSVVIAP